MSRTHDVIDTGIAAVGFPAAISVVMRRVFLHWHSVSVAPEFAYWWCEFRRCAIDRYVLFDDVKSKMLFVKYAEQFSVEEDNCLVVPKSLYGVFSKAHAVRIVEDFDNESSTLLTLSSHYSLPECL
jgi:hypothetical protein